jgi:uncharacterized membrane protein YoaK (UPF0700 family)
VRVSVLPFYGLSLAAGCVDAVSFVGFRGVFTANMTGNTVLLGIAIGAKFGVVPANIGVAPPLVAIAAFVVGAIAAVPIFRSGFAQLRAAAVVLAEGVLVAVAGAAFAGHVPGLGIMSCIVLVSFAMGAQSIVAERAGLPGISTTYVTGTLITAVVRRFSAGGRHRSQAAQDVWSWVAYLAGAVAGTLLIVALHRGALLPTVVLFVALAAWLYGSRLQPAE